MISHEMKFNEILISHEKSNGEILISHKKSNSEIFLKGQKWKISHRNLKFEIYKLFWWD